MERKPILLITTPMFNDDEKSNFLESIKEVKKDYHVIIQSFPNLTWKEITYTILK